MKDEFDDFNFKKQILAEHLDLSIEELGLSARNTRILKNCAIDNVAVLIKFTPSKLLKFRNFGKKALNEVQLKLREFGLKLKEF
jgi:DNA-directed RNA polymerase subunit alpha